MKYTLIIDSEREEEVVVYAHGESKLTRDIEKLTCSEEQTVYAYGDYEILNISLDSVACFFIEDGKLYAFKDKEKLYVKGRLYEIEERLSDRFVKINRSCIANLDFIEKFKVTFGGALLAVFKNGYSDYVSRRELKKVKEKVGL